MKKIMVKRADGGVSIVIPTKDATPELMERDAKNVDGYVSHQHIDDSQIPSDRYFRNAWICNDTGIEIDMSSARDIHMNKLREQRAKKFIDMGFPNRINAQVESAILDQPTKDMLQALRDIPQTYDLSTAKTPEELKDMIPDILK